MAIGDKTSVVMETTIATEDEHGIMQYATDDEATTGQTKNRAVTPFQLRNAFIQKNGIQQFQQLSLPMSSTYADTAGAWTNQTVPPMNSVDGFDYNPCVIGNKVYTLFHGGANPTAVTVGIRDLTDMSVSKKNMSGLTNTEYCGALFSHNDELHLLTFTSAVTGLNSKLHIYRLNLETGARTEINTPFPVAASVLGDYPTDYNGARHSQVMKISEFEYLVTSVGNPAPFYVNAAIFDFRTSLFTNLNIRTPNTAVHYAFAAVQKLPDGDILFAYNYSTGSTIRVYKIFMSNYALVNKGVINLGSVNLLTDGTGIQLDNGKMLCITSYNMPSGSNVFELDLENLTFDLNKFPKTYSTVNYNNFIVYNNVIMSFYTPAAYQYLPLQSTPAEDNPIVFKIFKGQKFNSLYSEINVKAIPEQEEFNITKQQQIAPTDLEIHLGQYDLDSPTPIIIESGV